MATAPVIPPEIERQLAEVVAEHVEDNERGKKAVNTPFPGAAGDVFGVPADIKVGQWSVRPFYDLDVELLKAINHPLYRDMLDGMEGKAPSSGFVARGPDAWILAWILTRTTDAAEGLLSEPEKCHNEARREFGVLRLPGIAAVVEACVEQMGRYSSTVLEYGHGKEEANAGNPPEAQ